MNIEVFKLLMIVLLMLLLFVYPLFHGSRWRYVFAFMAVYSLIAAVGAWS